jgi:hypothetical protein
MGGERTGKGVSGRGSVALMGLGERAHFAQLFESILLTSVLHLPPRPACG